MDVAKERAFQYNQGKAAGKLSKLTIRWKREIHWKIHRSGTGYPGPIACHYNDNTTAQTESAEESTELSNWNKLWIISECRSTLSEMGTPQMNIIRNH